MISGYDVSVPVVSNTWEEDITSTRQNIEWIRRMWMMTGIVPITGATLNYTYTSDDLTAITFGGTLAGSAAFTFSGAELTTEVWTLYTKTITVDHVYSAGKLNDSTITVT